jgi:hypothetical protein
MAVSEGRAQVELSPAGVGSGSVGRSTYIKDDLYRKRSTLTHCRTAVYHVAMATQPEKRIRSNKSAIRNSTAAASSRRVSHTTTSGRIVDTRVARSTKLVGSGGHQQKRVASDVALSAEDVVTAAFLEGLRSGRAQTGDVLQAMPTEELADLGAEAAREVVLSLQWSAAVGERLDTTAVTSLLGISRQALANRRASGSLIALEGTGTSFWPTWQFDHSDGAVSVRPVVLQVVSAFREYLGDRADSFLIASWASTPQDELKGAPPSAWNSASKDDDRVIEAAVQAAWAEAR